MDDFKDKAAPMGMEDGKGAGKKRRKRKVRKDAYGENKSIVKEILGMVFYFAIVLVITLAIVKYVGQRTEVKGDSMYPTLHDGDNLIVDKITYRFSDPERFDIIVFPYQHDKKTHYIKRIIGLPGETVQVVDGSIYINGNVLNEEYGNEKMVDAGLAANPMTLGEDEYFVLGDNRNNSQDSRLASVGNIHKDEIVGRAWVRIWPFSSFGILKHQ